MQSPGGWSGVDKGVTTWLDGGPASLTIRDYAAYGAKLRELAATNDTQQFKMTVGEFRAHFGDCILLEGENSDSPTATITFQRPGADPTSILTLYVPTAGDIQAMADADSGQGAYELPAFYREIFVEPIYADLSDPTYRERVRNARLAEYTTNKCH